MVQENVHNSPNGKNFLDNAPHSPNQKQVSIYSLLRNGYLPVFSFKIGLYYYLSIFRMDCSTYVLPYYAIVD
jgi:hypothetical protein